jgi:hypothetical protein
MFDSGGRFNLAIGIALFVALAFALGMAGLEYAYDDPAEHQTHAQQAETSPPPAPLASHGKQSGAYENEYYLREDLAAQRGMSYVATLQLLLSVGGLILIWQTLSATRETLREAENATKAALAGAEQARQQTRLAGEQLAIAEAQLADSRKPFLWVDVLSCVIEGTSHQTAELRIRNVGERSAVVTGGRAKLAFSAGPPAFPRRREDFEGGRILTVESRVITPNSSFESRVFLTGEYRARPNGTKLWLFGWVDYRDYAGADGVLPFSLFYVEAGGAHEGRFIDIDASRIGRAIMTRTEELHAQSYAEPIPPTHGGDPLGP